MSDGGKGSTPRPFSVSKEEFDNRWDNIFKKSPKEIQDAELEDEAFKIVEDRMRVTGTQGETDKI
jgi:hypothetical protein